MFTLDVNMPKVNFMLFTHGKGARDIGIWHKWLGMLISNVLSCWKDKILLEVFPNLE
jgi:hypothetical protein